MKIAFVVPGFSADERDWCIPAHTDLVRTLAEKHDVHVYALRYPHRTDSYRIGNAIVQSFGGADEHALDTAQLWRRVLMEHSREHSRRAFDAVLAIFGGEAGCVAMLCGKRLRLPSAVWFVNGELVGLRKIGYGADLNPSLRWMNKFVLRFADAVLCGCDAMTEMARARMIPRRRARVQTLPLGVDTTRFFPSPKPSAREAIDFVNVGSLLPVKDQSTLLGAMARVAETLPQARLMLVGVGPLETELRALTRALRLETHVTFAGNVKHDQLPSLYQNAHVFVQSSLHEGQGMALLEAAACGGAVCGTDVGALRDLARGGGAIGCATGDADALARAMLRTYEQRDALGTRAREIVAREYQLTQIGERLTTLYQELGAAV